MFAGRLNESITIERLKIKKNEYGEEESKAYKPIFQTRAEVQYNSGNRVSENNEIFFTTDIVFNVRWYNNINELDRIIWNNQPYRILSIERNRQWQMQRIHAELINE